jgi:hypothetical protein
MRLITRGLGVGGPLVTRGLAPDLTIPDPPLSSCGNDLLSRGAAWLSGQLQANASQPVIYQRGNAKIAICATFGKKLLKLNDDFGGIRMKWTDRDFIIPASSLIFSGSAVLPRPGDLIREPVGNTIEVYEVTPPDPTEPEWRWSDPFHTLLRVHAKHLKTEDA